MLCYKYKKEFEKKIVGRGRFDGLIGEQQTSIFFIGGLNNKGSCEPLVYEIHSIFMILTTCNMIHVYGTYILTHVIYYRYALYYILTHVK